MDIDCYEPLLVLMHKLPSFLYQQSANSRCTCHSVADVVSGPSLIALATWTSRISWRISCRENGWCAMAMWGPRCEHWFRFATGTHSLFEVFVYHKPVRDIGVISSPQLNAIVAGGLTLQDDPRHVFGPPGTRRCVFGPRSEVFKFKRCLGHPQAINPKMNGKQPEICEAHLSRCKARLGLVYNGLYMIAMIAIAYPSSSTHLQSISPSSFAELVLPTSWLKPPSNFRTLWRSTAGRLSLLLVESDNFFWSNPIWFAVD